MNLNKSFLKVIIATLILLIGVCAVSASDSISTDDVIAAQQDDAIAIEENDALAVEDEGQDVIAASEDADEVLAVEENPEVVEASADAVEILAAEEQPEAIAASDDPDDVLTVGVKDDVKLSVSSDDVLSSVKYKTFTLAKMKWPKKYINTDYSDLPYKWQKIFDKRSSKVYKTEAKKLKSLKKKNWYAYGDPYTQVKYKGKNAIIYLKLTCYKYT